MQLKLLLLLTFPFHSTFSRRFSRWLFLFQFSSLGGLPPFWNYLFLISIYSRTRRGRRDDFGASGRYVWLL
uniref:Putative secreted protein n=1 Tax=Xenopsylla cheopis TaxID=163159 RepID=A0A6M2DZP4_XENCH